MAKISAKQEEILRYIDRFTDAHGYAPSVREIGAAVGLRSTATVSYHMGQLREKGMISFDSGKKRAISTTTPKGNPIPVVGVVTAGMPILAVENQEGFLSWDGNPDCFALRVRGDSMINARIFHGDLLFVKKQESVDDGEIAVVLIDDEATVKRVYFNREDGILTLMPENPTYKPMRYSGSQLDRIRILGKVVSGQYKI